MASMQAAMKELRTLKQEETSMMNLASKISDQLNRLKVEELALQNLVRLQNEELERKSRGSQRSINRSLPVDETETFEDSEGESNDIKEYLEKGDKMKKMENDGIVPLNLVVNKYHEHEPMEEEEEEDDDDGDGRQTGKQANAGTDDYDIEIFVNSL